MKPKVAILMGSDSDFPVMERSVALLKEFGVGVEVRVLSAHRTPDETREFVRRAPGRGIKVFIAAAGGAAHLAGAVAAQTTCPVIGVPIASTEMQGIDALHATVQMPPGAPVATVAIGKFGAVNAALLAVQILAVSDKKLQKRLKGYKLRTAARVKKADRMLQKKL